MSKDTPTSFNSLAWVKHEIDHTLDTARQSIQQYAANPDETQHLVLASSNLRDAQGALEVANLEGAAMLTEETVAVIAALGKNELSDKQAACNQVLRSLTQLPDYLNYVQAGHTETPAVLLSVINDLRSLRKAPLVTDELNDIPGLADDTHVLQGQGHSGENLQKLADITRALFEVGLVGWYRDRDVPGSLGKMALVVHRLRMASNHLESRRLWWISGAVIEALKGGQLESSTALKPLMGKIDREIKRLFKQGEPDFAISIVPSLTKNLLHYVEAAEPGNAFVDEVRQTYFSDKATSADAELEALKENLNGQSQAVSQAAAESLQPSITELQQQLTDYQQGGFKSPESLERFIPDLKTLANALGAVGLEGRKSQASGIMQRLVTARQDGNQLSESELQYFAHTLVDIEDAVATLKSGADKQAVDTSNEPSSDRKYNEVRGVVIQEVLREIERCKNNIQHYAADLEEMRPMRETVGQFSQIAGSMRLLSLESASELVSNIRGAVELIIAGDIELDIDSLDNLAESIAAVEVYLEVLDTSNMAQEHYIDIGQQALVTMRSDNNIPELSQYNSFGELPEFVDDTPTAAFNSNESEDTASVLIDTPELDEGMLEGAIGLDPDEELEGSELSEVFGADASAMQEESELLSSSGLLPDKQELEKADSEFGEIPGFDEIAQEIEVGELDFHANDLGEDTSESQRLALDDLDQPLSPDVEGLAHQDSVSDTLETIETGAIDIDAESLPVSDVGASESQLKADSDSGSTAERSAEVSRSEIDQVADSISIDDEPTLSETGGSEIFPDIQFGQAATGELEAPEESGTEEERPELPELTDEDDSEVDLSFTGTSLDYSAEQQSLLDGDVFIELETDPGANEAPLDYVSMTQAEVEGWEPELFDEKSASEAAASAEDKAKPAGTAAIATGLVGAAIAGVTADELFTPADLEQGSDANVAGDDTIAMFGYQAQALYGLKMLSNKPDEEVYSIFLEELNEETAHIRVSFGRYQEDQNDLDALIVTRRSFHTIKGSGRLIGAQVVGEYAWVHERLLNQILDKQSQPSEELFQVVEAGISLLPQLQKQLERRELPSEEIHRQVDWADQLFRGVTSAASTEALEPELLEIDDLPELELDDIESADIDILHADAMTEPTIASIDRELIGVFTTDSRRHLEALRLALKASDENSETLFPESGLIALHTLNGAARTARVEEIAAPAGAAERYLGCLNDGAQAPDEEAREQLHELVSHIHSVLDALDHEEDSIEGETIAQQFNQLGDAFAAQQMIEAAGIGDTFEPEPVDDSLTNLAFEMPDEGGSFTLPVLDVESMKFGDNEPAAESQADVQTGDLEAAEVAETALLEDAAKSVEESAELSLQMTELQDIFAEECEQILGQCDAAMVRWQGTPEDADVVDEIKRELHTLKGSARMAGIESVGQTSHAMETLLQHLAGEKVEVGRDHFTVLNAAFDHIGEVAGALREHDELPTNNAILAALKQVEAGEALQQEDLRALVGINEPTTEPAAVEEPSVEPAVVESQPVRMLEGELDLPVNEQLTTESHESSLQEAIRIPAELLDRMVDNIGEVNVCHARVEQQVGSVKFNLQELDRTIRRVTEQLRRLEMEAEAQILNRHGDKEVHPDDSSARAKFDPLELDRYSNLQQLSRSLAETTNDLSSIHILLADEVREMEGSLVAQGKVSNELQEGLMRTRMSKFQLMVPRLRRVVRRTALELGKEVNLVISGDDNEMDRKMLEGIVVPLEHMLRNAVVHGIEDATERTAADKPEAGEITVSISREGPEVVIEVKDDGRGLDEQKIRQHAIEQGLLSSNDELTRGDVHNLILKPGFSTADTVSEDAGRGVGMDVVNSQLKQLNGMLDIQSQSGQGSVFRLALPFTLAINQALLLEAGDGIYAIPMSTIDGVMQASGKSLMEKLESKDAEISYSGNGYQITQLMAAMNRTQPAPLKADVTYPVVFANAGDQRVGFIVNRVIGNREVVVKPMGSLLQGVDHVSGATILGDGRIVVILDMAGLIRLTQQSAPLQALPQSEAVPVERQVVLVVDDSITIRKVTSKMLERHNFTVVTAKDGMDAVGKLSENHPDVILLDIEMPRMDGFEFAAHVRSSDEFSQLPIIMISSRTGAKHRDRAKELGVNHFLGKPYQDDELLAEIGRQLKTGE